MTQGKQGEHVIIVGDTGSGKTYLESKLLHLREHVIVLRTKPDDIKFSGFHKIRTFDHLGDIKFSKFLLVPSYDLQQFQLARTMDRVWREGGWTLAVDELYYATDILRLQRPINKLFTQGRSKRITVVAGMQRPAWISRFALSQSTHAFIFRCEGRDLTSLSQALSPRIVPYVDKLSGHQFCYFNRATREIKFGDANRLKDIFDVPAKVIANG